MPKLQPRQQLRYVPWEVSLAAAFVDNDLPPAAYEKELRKVIRKHLPSITAQLDSPQLIEVYDEELRALIEDELARN